MYNFPGPLLVLGVCGQDPAFPACSWGIVMGRQVSWETRGLSDDQGERGPHIRTEQGWNGNGAETHRGPPRTRRTSRRGGVLNPQGEVKHFTWGAGPECWEGPGTKGHLSESRGVQAFSLDLGAPSLCSFEVS